MLGPTLAPEDMETGSLMLPDVLKEYTHGNRLSHISTLNKQHVTVTNLSSGFGRTGDSNSSPFTLNPHNFGHIPDPFLTSVFLNGKWW